jgi:hypothetical protein
MIFLSVHLGLLGGFTWRFLFLDCPPRIPKWLHVQASNELPISNSKIMLICYEKSICIFIERRNSSAAARIV